MPIPLSPVLEPKTLDPLDRGLVGEWRFDRDTGLLPDWSGRGNHGTLKAGVVGTVQPEFMASDVGIVADFQDVTGENPNIEILDVPILDGMSQVSIEVYFKLRNLGDTDYPRIVAKEGSYQIAVQRTTGTLYCGIWGTGGNTGWITTASGYDWQHAVLNYDGDVADLYLNGVYIKSDSDASGDVVATANNLYFGALNTTVYGLHGQIALVRIYDRVQTAPEIHQRHQICTARASGIKHLWMIPWLTAADAAPPAGNPWYAYAQQ